MMNENSTGTAMPVDHTEVVQTGVPAVDSVLAEVSGLGDLPVAEHVAVFERAHDHLRRALDADSDG